MSRCVLAIVAACAWLHSANAWALDVAFRADRAVHFAALAGFALTFLIYVYRGRRGVPLYVRPVAAMAHIPEAVGRCAEQGTPVMYAPGLGSLTDPVTVASLHILNQVAFRAARLHTRTVVPNYGPLTWSVAQEVVRHAYARADRASEYDPDDVPYLTSRSFTYAAACAAIMVRQRPAAIFLLGHFYSESLILAETGAACGARLFGGTDSVEQLPFFIATCDHVLIGEELFAAAAGDDGDPVSRCVVKASDRFKIAIVALILLGAAAGALDAAGLWRAVGGAAPRVVHWFLSGGWL